jgi:hypothetical protein
MNPILKPTFPRVYVFVLIPFLLLCNSHSAYAEVNKSKLFADSSRNASRVREVLTSQQLFVVKIHPIKRKNAKPHTVKVRAELRNAFRVTSYENDTPHMDLNWAMCPGGVCSIPGTYKFGTPGYKKLDTPIAMAQAKLRKEKAKKY